ncbi:hypothetical protein ACFX13_042654 [Malus domestica]
MEYGPAGWTRKLDQGQNGRGERGNEVADGKRTNEHFCMEKKITNLGSKNIKEKEGGRVLQLEKKKLLIGGPIAT